LLYLVVEQAAAEQRETSKNPLVGWRLAVVISPRKVLTLGSFKATSEIVALQPKPLLIPKSSESLKYIKVTISTISPLLSISKFDGTQDISCALYHISFHRANTSSISRMHLLS